MILQMAMVIKRMIPSIKDGLLGPLFIFRPDYWIMNDPFNKEWDNELKQLLLRYSFTNIGSHYATLGDTNIWIGNHPYAAFTNERDDKRPSRLTIWRAKKLLDKQIELNENLPAREIDIESVMAVRDAYLRGGGRIPQKIPSNTKNVKVTMKNTFIKNKFGG